MAALTALAATAEADLKKTVAESYAKNKTTSKFSNEAIYNTVIGKIAQEDYITYKQALKDGVNAADYKDQKTWLEKGKANVAKVAAEQKKLLDAAKRRLAKAEKEADETNHKVGLAVQYYILGKIPYITADSQARSTTNPLVKKGLLLTAEKAKALMDKIEKEFPQVTSVIELPPANADVNEVVAFFKKELKPWQYALEVGGKRISSYVEVKKWADEAQKTLEEVSGE